MRRHRDAPMARPSGAGGGTESGVAGSGRGSRRTCQLARGLRRRRADAIFFTGIGSVADTSMAAVLQRPMARAEQRGPTNGCHERLAGQRALGARRRLGHPTTTGQQHRSHRRNRRDARHPEVRTYRAGQSISLTTTQIRHTLAVILR